MKRRIAGNRPESGRMEQNIAHLLSNTRLCTGPRDSTANSRLVPLPGFAGCAEHPYLNLLERFNCFYCAYGNGIAAYTREVAARTEQYWCPIKHARRIPQAHERYPLFFDHGDAEGYRTGLGRLRRHYETESGSPHAQAPRMPGPGG